MSAELELDGRHLARQIREVRDLVDATLTAVKTMQPAVSHLSDRVGRLEMRAHDMEARELDRVQRVGIGVRARWPSIVTLGLSFVLGASASAVALGVLLAGRY